jgi:hypothetical protein
LISIAKCWTQCAKYLDVLRRFGRFPHRNEILRRANTQQEEEFLRDWAERVPPAGMPKGKVESRQQCRALPLI